MYDETLNVLKFSAVAQKVCNVNMTAPQGMINQKWKLSSITHPHASHLCIFSVTWDLFNESWVISIS